ncbi:DUF1738 domain-containing protein [Pseudomonas sp. IT-P12]|uniref:hypothetical protein n=1 Tax=Pseudomonas sp. IT-P12 TaxID=3026450 RepID=UPI0039DFD223
MKFKTITTESAMSKLATFMAYAPAEKLAYIRKRSLVVRGEDLSGFSDHVLLDSLKSVERRMQQYIDQFEQVKCAVTPGLILDRDLVAKTNEFFNVAVPTGIESILRALQPGADLTSLYDQALNKAIDALFTDRVYLREQLELICAAIRNPALVCEVIRTDAKTYKQLYFPVLDPFVKGLEAPFALAFPMFMGVESCLLIHSAGLRVNETYTPRVKGFTHEFFMYLVLHELTHLLRYTNDTAYVFAGMKGVSEFDVYSMASLSANDTHNADNYTVLILNALSLLHTQGRLDLRQF